MQTPRKFATKLLLVFLDTWVKLPAIHSLNKYLYMSKRHNEPERVIMVKIRKLLTYMEHMHPDRGYVNDGTTLMHLFSTTVLWVLLLSYPFYR